MFSGAVLPLEPNAPPMSPLTTRKRFSGTLKMSSAKMRRTRMDRADAAIEREAAVPRIIVADAAARLDRVVHDAADDEVLLHHMLGLGEGSGHRGLVAELEHVRDIVGAFVPHRGRARSDRIGGADHVGQRFV